ncbi:XRE family transcriptional regulator [Streptomyces luteoverticillatus]|uniref:XRE family transcriptional regulator n=2 Tax=Streptomyces luteoverticillatus TaxID=66425 RepID=A0A3Q9FYB3_STRLT|nr:XRE family transcriptional regulator [Streptomyces luteoverticillatus]
MRGMTDHLTFGRRVSLYRERRMLSQRELGELVNRTEDWVYRVESDRIPVNSVRILTDLADALRVHLEDLQGSPTLLDDQDDHKGSVPAIRAALMQSRRLSGDLFDRREVPHLARVMAEVDRAWELYQASRYARLGEVLPGLLADARLAVHSNARGPRNAAALRQFALALHVAAVYLRKLGETNLAWTAIDQGDMVASELGDPGVTLALRRGVAHVQLGAGLAQEAAGVTLNAAQDLVEGWWKSSPVALSLYGTLFLNGAVAAARMRDDGLTDEMLDKAQAAADRLGGNRNEMWTAFGPANVRIHQLATALETEDIATALAMVSRPDMCRLGSGLPVERQARLLLDMARTYGEARRPEESVDHLKRAFKKAPEQIRAHEFARDLARRLAKQTRQRDVHELAVRIGAVR